MIIMIMTTITMVGIIMIVVSYDHVATRGTIQHGILPTVFHGMKDIVHLGLIVIHL